MAWSPTPSGPLTFWRACPVCFDLMQRSDDPARVIADRDAHLLVNHPWVPEDSPMRTPPSFWKDRL